MPNKRYNGTKHGVPTVRRKRQKQAEKPHMATIKTKGGKRK